MNAGLADLPADNTRLRKRDALLALRSSDAVRSRCHSLYRWMRDGHSRHFVVDENKLRDVARYVAAVTRSDYPDISVPYHSRWRHFSAGGHDRWNALALRADGRTRTMAALDLAVVSVLLDAGAGERWRYREDATGETYTRSEGLAVASFAAFRSGLFSSDRDDPLRVDARALRSLNGSALAASLQVRDDNPLQGFEQRLSLLRRVGEALDARSDFFDVQPARPAHLIDVTADRDISAPALLARLLDVFAPIWPSALVRDGTIVGDAGIHPALATDDASSGIVPFHKLSQWLAYSLVEPLQAAGIRVGAIDRLTGLPEYRNGGLFLDFGVLSLRQERARVAAHEVSSELVIEWRAATVALLDALLPLVRSELGIGEDFLLPHLLQGGSWSAGRKIALERRPPEGEPPLRLMTDGTTF